MKQILKKSIIVGVVACFAFSAAAQKNDDIKTKITNALTSIANKYTVLGKAKTKVKNISVDSNSKRIVIDVNDNLSYVPMRNENVREMYDSVKKYFTVEQCKTYKFQIITDKNSVEDLIPNFYRTKNIERNRKFTRQSNSQLVKNTSKPYEITNGLQNRHIALWQSHGWYYEQKLARWEWQRARIFQTVEDLYTQSYVLPYLVPMLEKAGANVFLPRERDVQKNEVIVDNDVCSGESEYKETHGHKKWELATNGNGFANKKDFYIEGENPFAMGSYREVKTIGENEEPSIAEWIPDFPASGKYAVYVSYKTLPNSTTDAAYSVLHKGGETNFIVNQKMGGGTWIYLGTFAFDKGRNKHFGVRLSNKSATPNMIVTADAVKFGGGIGNIARRPNPEGLEVENTKSSEIKDDTPQIFPPVEYDYETSGYPRFCEGARYWMQWAGVPDTIYNRNENKNDYTDDYSARGNWVNYLAGGSSVLPQRPGLNIPVDLAFAFHSDAGTTLNDSIIGTLGIFMTKFNNDKFENGVSRYASRDLTDLIQTNIVNDVRRVFGADEWNRRGMWNKSYSEARVPNVPTMLLELLSHQNFADMRYGLDPRFRFVVSRAVYKGMLKFVANQNNFDYVVEPLPVEQFSAEFTGDGDSQVELRWKPVADESEPSAMPDKYVVYTRVGDDDFDNGTIIDNPECVVNIDKDKIYSFKVTAINAGGESFPSEILSVCKANNDYGIVLIVNNFTRISAPASFEVDTIRAGFIDEIDHGVPDKYDISYIGSQYEQRRQIPWMDDDAAGFGASNANYETEVIAGNTFDYPIVHGKSILSAGYSFVSCSAKAVENYQVNLNRYSVIDFIFGKQRTTYIGNRKSAPCFKTFTPELENAITNYCNGGGKILISGAFVGTDLWDTDKIVPQDTAFAKNVLKFQWRTNMASISGKVKGVTSPVIPKKLGKYEFNNTLNDKIYIVEAPDAIEPVGNTAYTIFRYSENNLSAGVASVNNGNKTCILGFPIETITDEKQRNDLMKGILDFFTGNL